MSASEYKLNEDSEDLSPWLLGARARLSDSLLAVFESTSISLSGVGSESELPVNSSSLTKFPMLMTLNSGLIGLGVLSMPSFRQAINCEYLPEPGRYPTYEMPSSVPWQE